MKTIKNLNYCVDLASKIHNRKLKKPNEDYCISDMENGIFIVVDGVTRVHAEYDEHPFESASLEVAKLFSTKAHEFLKANLNSENPEELLRAGVAHANSFIKSIRAQKTVEEWGFYPSALGIVSILRDNVLYYVCAGDCMGVLLRGSSKITFGKQLTLEAVDLHKVSKQKRYSVYCNNFENDLGYTVFNGDEGVEKHVEFGFINILPSDVLLLASDGMQYFIKYEKNETLRAVSASEMIELSNKYDRLPYSEYADDKTVIKLVFDKK